MRTSIFADATTEDERMCAQWIADYVRPYRLINHMYTSMSLWQIATRDTDANITHGQFKRLMERAGYEAVDPLRDNCEYRISSTLIRNRPKAKVGGWQQHRTAYQGWRYR